MDMGFLWGNDENILELVDNSVNTLKTLNCTFSRGELYGFLIIFEYFLILMKKRNERLINVVI